MNRLAVLYWRMRARLSLWALRIGLAVCVLVGASGCVNGKLSPAVGPIATTIEQVACKIVEIADPSDSTDVANVCDVAVPAVSGVLTLFSSKSRHSASASPSLCHLVPISPDGAHGYGVVCDRICGDLSQATAADPCPAVDAALRKASLQ